jgi:hypothetical protein
MPWQWRILIENAISGIKRFNILVHAFRNRKTGMEDDAIALGRVYGTSFWPNIIWEQLYLSCW